ncbi:hypothetical protein PT974_02557 [Cladobotryum mycophilum]|uniref:Uncharacterized protein n=1 Tax=Cladobotryum mycophilum TaxID=491253 RepID=A0ABR0SYY8_9HYPO
MPSDNTQGTIPLDDMRNRPSSNSAVLRKERKAPKSTADLDNDLDRTKDKDKHRDKGKVDNEESPPELNNLAAVDEVDLLEFEPEEMSDSIPPSLVPARKHSITVPSPFREPFTSDDDEFESVQMPGSIYSSAESFPSMEREAFAPRRQRSDSADRGEEMMARRQLQELYDTIQTLKAEKKVVESEAREATAQVEELKHLLSADMQEIAKDAESLGQEMRKLKDENRLLRDELNDAQSHIFSLQPYRKELTSDEVSRQYSDLVEQVQDWVQKFMNPWLDDYEAGIEALVAKASKQSNEVSRFRRTMQKYPDLIHGSMFSETDEDIIVAIIMRFLNDNIFQKVLYGSIQHYTEMISFIENMMQASVEPRRDLFAVRTWTAEGYNALLSAPQFKGVRVRRSKDMTTELGSMLQIFCKKDQFQWFCQNMEENCVAPAMALYEKLQVSTHHFYLDINPYISWGPGNRISLSSEFIDNVGTLDCKNILQNRKGFNMAKMDPQPTKAQLHKELMNVCTVVPALYIRQIGQRDNIKAPTVVCKQRMLVAWGSEEKREKFANEGDPTLVSQLYFPKSKKKGEGWPW